MSFHLADYIDIIWNDFISGHLIYFAFWFFSTDLSKLNSLTVGNDLGLKLI